MICVFPFFSCRQAEEAIAFPLDEIAEGDLAFRCGHGVFSRAVELAEDGIYSHVGIVVYEGDRWRVAHAVPGERENSSDFDRVKIEDLSVFFSKRRAKRGCLVRTCHSDNPFMHSICQDAVHSARDSIRFDSDYNIDDSTKVYCTEFVWRLYKAYGMDLTDGRRRFINAFHVKGDVIFPEHILLHPGNTIYFNF